MAYIFNGVKNELSPISKNMSIPTVVTQDFLRA